MTKIKEGYKETEIGVIPEDWEVSILNDISNNKGEYGIGAKAVDYKVNKPRYLRITDIDEYGRLIKDNEYKTIEEDEYEDYLLKKDDLVFARTGNTTGKTYLYNSNDGELVFAGFLIKFSINKSKANSEYVRQYCFTKRYWDWVKQSSTRSGQPGINSKQYGELKLPLPPLLEQQRIAEILSTTDSHIEKLDKTIEDYQLLKKGMMKKLLTEGIGHTEFKETEIGRIPKEWEVKSLGEISKYRRGSFPQPYGNPEWYDDENGFPFIQVYDIDDNFQLKPTTKRRISKLATEMSVFAEAGTVLVTLQGSIGKTAITQYDAYVDRTLLLFTEFNVEFDKHFFLFVIDALFSIEKNKADGGVIKTITKETLTKFLIPIPPIEEQKLIAVTLENITQPINLMLQDLEDYKLLKKSLMEKLLTGKVRTI